MSDAVAFRWEFLVLDENPGDATPDKLPWMLAGACRVQSAGGRFEELYRLDEIWEGNERPHVVLVDLVWDNVPRWAEEDPALAGTGLPVLECGQPACSCGLADQVDNPLTSETCLRARAAFTQQWLDRIAFAQKSATTWLQWLINSKDIGLWLAAWVSHLYPEAELALYSSSAKEIECRPGLAPWLRFRSPHTHVLHQDANQPLDKWDLLPLLRKLQVGRLNRNMELRLWAQKVWLCESLDTQAPDLVMASAEAGGLVRYEPRVFFPQLDSSWLLDRQQELQQLEPIVFAVVPDQAAAALSGAEHLLREPVRGGALNDKTRSLVNDLLFGSLPRSAPALSQFQAGDYRGAWESAWATLYDGLPLIRKMAKESRDLPDYPAPSRQGEPIDPVWEVPRLRRKRLPLDLNHWNAVQSVLTANADGEQFELRADLCNSRLVLRFIGGSSFRDEDDFRATAVASIEKGWHRGLPQLLLFASRYRADSLAILIADRWHPVRGSDEATPEPAAGGRGGIRMTILMPDR